MGIQLIPIFHYDIISCCPSPSHAIAVHHVEYYQVMIERGYVTLITSFIRKHMSRSAVGTYIVRKKKYESQSKNMAKISKVSD